MKANGNFIRLVGMLFYIFLYASSMAQYKPLSPTFGKDVIFGNYPDYTASSTKIAVAGNGYIYVLVKVVDTDAQGFILYRSTNGGLTFDYLTGYDASLTLYSSSEFDLAVTGYDQSDIRIWIAELDNAYAPPYISGISLLKYDFEAKKLGVPYTKDWGSFPDKLYDISIATDYRSPGSGSDPFSIAIAYTGNVDFTDYLVYAYSLDSSANWTEKDISSSFGTNVFGRVSLALGATQTYNLGYYAVAFECNKSGDLGDIGVMMNYTNNEGVWTIPVLVNQKMPSETGKACCPSITLMDNVLANPSNPIAFPMVVVYEDRGTSPDEVNLTYNTLLDSYIVGNQATLDDFSSNWIDGLNVDLENEYEPDLSFDKTYNNFLLTYCNTDFNRLVYAYASMDGIQSNEWTFIDNYRDSSNTFEWDIAPHVDINPVNASACFTWIEKDPGDGHYSDYFDSEWSTIGFGVKEPAANIASFSLYPNPSHDQVIVNITKPGTYDLTVSNLTGKVILKQNVDKRTNTLNLNGLNPGVYFVRVSGVGSDESQKLIIR